MNPCITVAFSAFSLALVSIGAQASDNKPAAPGTAAEPVVVVTRGSAAIRFDEIDARLSQMPVIHRQGFIDSPQRIQELLSGMLLEEQLANEAKRLGIDQIPAIQTELELVRQKVLARAVVDAYASQIVIPDLNLLARERYDANPSRFMSETTLQLKHVLIQTQTHTDAEARKIAEDVHAQAVAGEPSFDELIAKYTEELNNGMRSDGVLKDVVKGQMVEPFEIAAFKLAKPGEISGVVKTQFGYHVIQLIDRVAPKRAEFDKVRDILIAEEKERYINDRKQQMVAEFSKLELAANPELVASLRERYTPEGEGTKALQSALFAAPVKTLEPKVAATAPAGTAAP